MRLYILLKLFFINSCTRCRETEPARLARVGPLQLTPFIIFHHKDGFYYISSKNTRHFLSF